MPPAPQKRSFWEREFTLSKITFYILFHGLHIGMFVLGWYVVLPAFLALSSDGPQQAC
jgi:hypothetical protein